MYRNGNNIIAGIIFTSSSLLCFLSLFGVFGTFSEVFNAIIYGLFGQSVYALVFSLFIGGIMLLLRRPITLSNKVITLFTTLLVIALCVLNSATTVSHIIINNPSGYLVNVFNNGINSAGGVINGLMICLPMCYLGYRITLFSFIALLALFALIIYKVAYKKDRLSAAGQSICLPIIQNQDIDIPIIDSAKGSSNKTNIKRTHKSEKSDINNAYQTNIFKEVGSIPFNKDDFSYLNNSYNKDSQFKSYTEHSDYNDYYERADSDINASSRVKRPYMNQQESGREYKNQDYIDNLYDIPLYDEETTEDTESNVSPSTIQSISDIPIANIKKKSESQENMTFDTEKAVFVPPNKINKAINKNDKEKVAVNSQEVASTFYIRPPVDMLLDPESNSGQLNDFIRDKISVLTELFKITDYNARVVSTTIGPSIIRFELAVEDINITKINNHKELYIAKLKSNIDIHIPLPNKSTIGIDIPSPSPRIVRFKEMISDENFWQSNKINFVVGQTVDGSNYYCNLKDMKHMLVAGTTGSGKSVSLNNLLCSLVFKHSPEELKLIIIDPKRMDFLAYNELPHMIFKYVIDETYPAKCAIDWVVGEMERRCKTMALANCNNLELYNKTMPHKKMPFILVMIDEFNDLCMSSSDKSIIDGIVRIAQKARAAGIHLVVATQRPSADVIKGSLKTNLSTRLVLKVSSPVDSLVALGERGANTLLGNGDMFFRVSADSEHLQAPFISDDEVRGILDFIRENNPSDFDESLVDIISGEDKKSGNFSVRSAVELLSTDDIIKLREIMELIFDGASITTSFLQRRTGMGFSRTAKILDALEELGCIEKSIDNPQKKVLSVSRDDFEKIYNNLDA